MEMAWATNAEIMEHGEGVVRHVARTLLEEQEQERKTPCGIVHVCHQPRRWQCTIARMDIHQLLNQLVFALLHKHT